MSLVYILHDYHTLLFESREKKAQEYLANTPITKYMPVFTCTMRLYHYLGLLNLWFFCQ
jgi:hypothetical protein